MDNTNFRVTLRLKTLSVGGSSQLLEAGLQFYPILVTAALVLALLWAVGCEMHIDKETMAVAARLPCLEIFLFIINIFYQVNKFAAG